MALGLNFRAKNIFTSESREGNPSGKQVTFGLEKWLLSGESSLHLESVQEIKIGQILFPLRVVGLFFFFSLCAGKTLPEIPRELYLGFPCTFTCGSQPGCPQSCIFRVERLEFGLKSPKFPEEHPEPGTGASPHQWEAEIPGPCGV